MGVELLNNFAEGLYFDSIGTAYEFCAENDTVIADRGNKEVKHTLKSKVMERLKNRGLDNVTVDFTPRPSYPMTEEEKEKDKRRKQSNRDSAQRCREKQKKEDERNRNLLVHLKEQQSQLLDRVNKSEEEKNKLLFKLKNVLPDSYIQDALDKIKHVTNKNKDHRNQIKSLHSNEHESARSSVTADHNFTESNIFEENCPESEIFLSSLHSFSVDERHVNGIAAFLEVGNEETVQFLGNFASVTNMEVQPDQLEEQLVFDENLTLLELSC